MDPTLELARVVLDLEDREHVPPGDRRTLAQYHVDEVSDIARLAREVIRLRALADSYAKAQAKQLRALLDGTPAQPAQRGQLPARRLTAHEAQQLKHALNFAAMGREGIAEAKLCPSPELHRALAAALDRATILQDECSHADFEWPMLACPTCWAPSEVASGQLTRAGDAQPSGRPDVTPPSDTCHHGARLCEHDDCATGCQLCEARLAELPGDAG